MTLHKDSMQHVSSGCWSEVAMDVLDHRAEHWTEHLLNALDTL
eukprot:CAMPEP_0169241558 /NCGR_PEP_ID=MMETSP1016-20121227/32069_1 /TAXON_ID=342587 /ORGANISM="Karlodinium micrum, Strain CCMP2283" /LENGTH=42 /DNA_ID= /DNA_START= /DNA_END= /DNA_ORIENTATION=